VGSLGGLIALQEEKAELAGTHLLDEETGEYNLPFIKRILTGREVAVVNLVYRIQGMMVASKNPRKIKSMADLRRNEITYINRQKGSGTRVLLDMQLKRLGIAPFEIKGYDIELDTHLAVGSAIAQGKADAGLGIEAAARSCGLDFLPLFRERYDLVIPGQIYRSELLAPMLEIINSDEFKRIVNKVDGYDTSETGSTSFVS
jgi:putative molybdopterin biosynthesis protein